MRMPPALLEAMKRNGLQVRSSGNGIKRIDGSVRLMWVDVNCLSSIPLEDIPKYTHSPELLYKCMGGKSNPIPESFFRVNESIIVPFLLCRLEANDAQEQT